MKSLEEIKSDLKEIRYYYTRKQSFDEAAIELGKNIVTAKVSEYNEAARYLSPILYDIYFGLYVKSYTQMNLANEIGYTIEYVNRLNKQILLYMQKRIAD